jgi:hypothetical protein
MPYSILKDFRSFLKDENKILSVVRANNRAGFDSSTVVVPLKLFRA